MKLFRPIGVALCLAIFLICAWLAPIDEPATQQVHAGLRRALVTYGTARVMHGAFSVIQGTQFNVAPAGLGTTLSPGQSLAPVTEMLKQFSDVMLLVCVSFGIQKLLISIGGFWVISLALTITALGWAFQFVRRRQSPEWLLKLLIVLLMVRFALPLTILGTDVLFKTFLEKDYTASQNAISSVPNQVETMASLDSTDTKNPSIFGSMKEWFLEKLKGIAARHEAIKNSVELAAQHMVTLIGIFVLQTLMLPLLLLWALSGLAKVCFQTLMGRSPKPVVP